MTGLDWIFVVSGIAAIALGFERLVRFHAEPATLNHKAFLVCLFALGMATIANGILPLTADFHNIGMGLSRALIAVLLGGLEIVALTLRCETVRPAVVRRVIIRSAAVTTILLLTWIVGFSQVGPIDNLSESAPDNAAVRIHTTIFAAYLIWTLMRIIVLCLHRLPHDIRRRPISVTALLMVAAGCSGFVVVNVVITAQQALGWETDADRWHAPTPFLITLCVAGAALLAFGERVHEELSARHALKTLRPLWHRSIELLPHDMHLSTDHLSSPGRLQRAYVEISDALCTLRVDTTEQLDTDTVAAALHRGEITSDAEAPTLTQALPARSTRREDLDMIHRLATAYRRTAASSRRSTVAAR